ncbi:MAG: EI24 domain-containing protein [Pseudomonadota bacterium]
MPFVMTPLLMAVRQLADPAVLKVLFKSLGVTVAVFAALGVVLFFGLRWGFSQWGASDGGLAEATAAALIALTAGWFLFRVVALAVLQFFADEIVAAVEERHYPAAARSAKKLPFRRDLRNSLRGVSRAVGYNLLALPVAIALIFTGIGSALVFLLVNAVLLGRELTDMAWFRHCTETEQTNTPVPGSNRIALGGVTAGLMLVPFLGLLAPVIGAAAGTHLTHRFMGNSSAKRDAHA